MSPVLLLLLAVPSVARGVEPAPAPGEGQVDRGVVVEPHLSISSSSNFVALLNGGGQQAASPSYGGALYAGYKWGRLMVGLGVGLSWQQLHNDDSVGLDPFQPASNPVRRTFSSVSLLAVPGIRVGLLQSPSRRVELYGQFDVGYSRQASSTSAIDPATDGPAPKVSTVDYSYRHDPWWMLADVGLGVRYWPDPHFAVGLVTLLNVQYTENELIRTPYDQNGVAGATSTLSYSQVSLGLGGALTVTGVF